MRISIRHKIFLILLLTIGLVVTGLTLFMTWSLEEGFVRFIDVRQQARIDGIAERLIGEYVESGGWQRLDENELRWAQLLIGNTSNMPKHRPARTAAPANGAGNDALLTTIKAGERGFLRVEHRVMLLDADRSIIYGEPELADHLTLYPINVDNRTVGYLGVLPGLSLVDLNATHFLEEQSDTFVLIALIVMLVSAILAYPFAKHLIRPLRALTEGSRALAAGHYDTRVPVQSGSRDELSQLGQDFNSLAKTLEDNELIRRQWVADISHEIRTPLAVLRGELEALQDGVRALDMKAVHSLHGETLHLGRLVDDLYELSLSDAGALQYRMALVDPVAILREDLDAYAEEFRGMHMTVTLEDRLPGPAPVRADADRLEQMFHNLLSNALRYTDAGGRLVIRASRDERHLLLDFMDSAPAVPEEDLPRLFDRLYRVESSRNRAHGGAGLGLAICRNIVHAHGGSITAQASDLGGLWVRVALPLS